MLQYLGDTRKYEFLWKKDLAQDLEAFIAESPPEQRAVTGSEGEPLEVVLELIGVDLGRTVSLLQWRWFSRDATQPRISHVQAD